MNNVELLASTGDKNIDRIIRGVIGIFETVFPARIRSYYLDGSYTDGTAIPHVSDIDGYIIFKQDFLNATEREHAWHLVNQCSHLTQPEFDIIPTDVAIPDLSFPRAGSWQSFFSHVST